MFAASLTGAEREDSPFTHKRGARIMKERSASGGRSWMRRQLPSASTHIRFHGLPSCGQSLSGSAGQLGNM
jgi:hypothetical protein